MGIRSGTGHVRARRARSAIGGSRVPVALAVVGVLLAGTALARRAGYQLGWNTVVRCRQGHLFTTVWIPGASVKAVRLGWWRFQRCPVGNHWAVVSPVRAADLTDEQRSAAMQHHDVHLP
jgi:hypothetical protein